MDLVLAALQWDPHIRGALIVLVAILILPGSVYLLLATNTGPRMGMLLAIAGLSGWMMIMGVVWMVFGIGLKGRDPSWKPKEMITGSLTNRTTAEAMSDFPTGKWKKLDPTTAPQLSDAQATVDHILVPATTGGGHGEETGGLSEDEKIRYKSPFKTQAGYIQEAGYETGGDNELFTIGKHDFFFRHSPHYIVVQVRPTVPVCSDSGEPKGCIPQAAEGEPEPDKVADMSAPLTTMILVRDLGSVRFPPFLIALGSLLVFGVTCSVLHERDKEIMRARGQIPQPA